LILFLEKGNENNEKYLQVLTYLAKVSNEYLNVMAYTVHAKDKDGPVRKEVNVQKLPIFKSYKNGVTGKTKSKGAYEVAWLDSFDLESKKGQMKIAKHILEEVNEGIEHDVIEVNSEMYFWSNVETREDNKVFVSYLYNGKSEDIDNSFKVISMDPRLQDKYRFYAINNPGEHLIMEGAEDLPFIQGSFLASAGKDAADVQPGEYSMWRTDPRAKNKQGKYTYQMLMFELLSHYPAL